LKGKRRAWTARISSAIFWNTYQSKRHDKV
jgi:hypothetical protein